MTLIEVLTMLIQGEFEPGATVTDEGIEFAVAENNGLVIKFGETVENLTLLSRTTFLKKICNQTE
jgi:hypothetical protein